jgi:MSHA biogenesis protein MshP
LPVKSLVRGRRPLLQRNDQSGFALVLAVFVITVLAALAAYILTVSGVQRQTSVLTLQEARALNAARSGVQRAAYQVLKPASPAADDCPARSRASLHPKASSLASFTISVEYCKTTHTAHGDPVVVYVIDATAESGDPGTPDYVSRHVQSIISDD